MVLFDMPTPFLLVMLPTTQSNASLPAQNMVHVLNARPPLKIFKTRNQQKIEISLGLKEL
jgi:hypothetical protein